MKNVVASGLYIHDINVNYTGNQSEEIRAAYAAALEKKSQGVFDYMPDPETDFDNDASSIDDVQSIVSDGAFNYGTGGVMMGAGTSRVNGPTWAGKRVDRKQRNRARGALRHVFIGQLGAPSRVG